MADDPLLDELARQAGTLDTDDRPALAARLSAARAYLSPHVDGHGIPKDVEPFRIPTDPLRTAWPKLRAAGIPAGLGIA